MKRYCPHCRTRLRLRDITCLYCRQSTLSWLHRSVIAVVALTTVFYLLKAF
jgi:hypothetical protein